MEFKFITEITSVMKQIEVNSYNELYGANSNQNGIKNGTIMEIATEMNAVLKIAAEIKSV